MIIGFAYIFMMFISLDTIVATNQPKFLYFERDFDTDITQTINSPLNIYGENKNLKARIIKAPLLEPVSACKNGLRMDVTGKCRRVL